MRIGLTSIFVDDQHRAERFYTDVVGRRGQGHRSIRPGRALADAVSPDDPDGTDVVLIQADEPARASQRADRATGRSGRSGRSGRPMISLSTDDRQRDNDALKAKSPAFVQETVRMDYRGMDTVLAETCGTLINPQEGRPARTGAQHRPSSPTATRPVLDAWRFVGSRTSDRTRHE